MTSQSTSNPFDILPNELIIDIFILIRHESAFFMNPSDKWISSVVRLSSVSHRWRDIAITTPQFWSFFVLSTPNSIQLAPLFFERSKPLPIDLIILHLSSKDILPLSSPENSRIRSLDYRFISPDELNESLLVVSPATNLDTLKIRCDPRFDWDCHSSQHFAVVKNATRLRSVVLKGTCSHLSPPLVNLTHLEIHGFSPTFPEFRALFDSNPALSTLCLPRFFPADWLDEKHPPGPIDASSLRSFSVGLGMHWSREICMLTFLRMDNLEYLEIAGSYTGHITNHFSSANGLSRVRTLRLHNFVIDVVHAPDAPLWSALNAVARVELSGVSRFSNLLAAKTDDKIYFPKLTDILCDNFESLREMVEIICSRSAVGLSRVEVPSHFEFLLQQEVATKLNAANIELVFVNDKDATKTIVHYDSEDEDEDEEDEENLDSDELSWSDYDNYNDYDYDDYDDHDDHDDLFEDFGLLEGPDLNGWDE
ncbi:hypothetical protein C8J55DRAFT_558952 [Lentinula edodes]|uniref:F-box domain-containing protein n=1 Tax=Lentinula lateritia TaxID=40482 RepID=A0A9W9AKI7_9AGAR|nr:hypothetical protein C8J55DRAFT_558952 [Lentinula edodes]